VAARDGARTAADLAAYQRAFVAMDSGPAQLLVVAEAGQDVVATMHLSVIPGLARRGALRAPIGAVRVSEAYRSGGPGAAMISWAIDETRRQGCGLGLLTTDKSRTNAHRCYERPGFVSSHEGMKLALRPRASQAGH
jgi:GNAT superfamily N-acetyltransferase